MSDEFNHVLKEAGPSCPVRVAGWRDSLPSPGERIIQVENESRAQRAVDYRISRRMEEKAELDWVRFTYFAKKDGFSDIFHYLLQLFSLSGIWIRQTVFADVHKLQMNYLGYEKHLL